MQTHRTWVELNSKALQSNIEQIRSILTDGADFCAVVKSNAYGHGLAQISQLCANAGVTSFLVNSLEEGEVIRKAQPHSTIYIWNYVTQAELDRTPILSNYVLPIFQMDQFNLYSQIARERNATIRVNVIVNTGMNRLGLELKEVQRASQELISAQRELALESVTSHLCCATKSIETHSEQQNTAFLEALKVIYAKRLSPKFIHIGNSSAIIKSPDYHYNMARIGALMYGLWPSEYIEKRSKITHALQLEPVLSWKTQISQVREVQKGETIGYENQVICDRPLRMAVLPVGYHDGLLSKLGKHEHVLIQGRACPVLSVTMNMMIVDVSSLPNVKPGEVAVLIGKSGMHSIPALWSGYDTRNITTSIAPSIPRILV